MLAVMSFAWAPRTRETYSTGLLVFHVFCDSRDIPESQRCPVSTTLLLTFITTCAGAYSGSAVANYVFGIHAWHTLHGASWLISKIEVAAALEGASALAPASSKRPKRLPFTPDLLIQIRSTLDLTYPL